METSGGTSAVPLPRVGLEERGTPMLDARTARILAKENEEDIEARGRGFEIGEEVWREGLFKYRDVYIARW